MLLGRRYSTGFSCNDPRARNRRCPRRPPPTLGCAPLHIVAFNTRTDLSEARRCDGTHISSSEEVWPDLADETSRPNQVLIVSRQLTLPLPHPKLLRPLREYSVPGIEIFAPPLPAPCCRATPTRMNRR